MTDQTFGRGSETTRQSAAVGSRLVIANRYEVDVDRPLGVGGMAMVYPGRDLRTRRPVALKTLKPEYQNDPATRQRFRREARMMAFVSHPNLVTIYDLHEEPNGSWVVMEYVPGETLKQHVEREGPLHPEEVGRILDQLADALGQFHRRRLVHLDIKPQNLIREPDGTIKLIDFGLAQPAGPAQEMVGGTAFGTVAYLAPEQASGGAVDAATDVYSLGCVVYELLTGQPPFAADGTDAKHDLIRAHLEREPLPPSMVRPDLALPGWIDDVLGWALAKRRDDRFHDVASFARVFRSGLDGDEADFLGTSQHTMPLPAVPAHAEARPRQRERSAAVMSPPAAVPTLEPSAPSVARRVYVAGGRAARRARRFRQTLWKLTIIFAIGNALLALVLLGRDGPEALVARFLSVAPGTSTEVVVDELNLRALPSAESEVLTLLEAGDEVRVSGLATVAEGERWWPVEVVEDGVAYDGFVWDGGLEPNVWTGRLSWMQDIIERIQGVRDGIGDVLDGVTGVF